MRRGFARSRPLNSRVALWAFLVLSPKAALAAGKLVPSFLESAETPSEEFTFLSLDSTATIAGCVQEYPSYEIHFPVTWKNGAFTRFPVGAKSFGCVSALNDAGTVLLQLSEYVGANSAAT